MFKPYAIVDESPDEITYEFKTIYLWIPYAILAAGWFAFVRKNQVLGMAAGGCMVVYLKTRSPCLGGSFDWTLGARDVRA